MKYLLALCLVACSSSSASSEDYKTFHKVVVSQERYERFMDMCFAALAMGEFGTLKPNEHDCRERAVLAGLLKLERVRISP